jgi:hypothetical protein
MIVSIVIKNLVNVQINQDIRIYANLNQYHWWKVKWINKIVKDCKIN